MENWKDVVGYEGLYQVSDIGNVRSYDRVVRNAWGGYRVSPSRNIPLSNNAGYLTVGLMKNSMWKTYRVHRLVAIAFIRPPVNEEEEVCHKDGIRSHNHLSNLRWGTALDNAHDKVIHGTHPVGDRNGNAKLSSEDVLRVVELSKVMTQLEIAAYLSINEITVSHILCGRTWSHLTGIKFIRKHVTVTSDLIENIHRLKNEGRTLNEISKELGISKATAFRHSKTGGLSTIEGALS